MGGVCDPLRRAIRFPSKGGEQLKARRFLSRPTGKSQAGQGMVEYALILVLVSIVVIVILLTMGGQISNVFSNVVTALNA